LDFGSSKLPEIRQFGLIFWNLAAERLVWGEFGQIFYFGSSKLPEMLEFGLTFWKLAAESLVWGANFAEILI
jgi:hypothetical protein